MIKSNLEITILATIYFIIFTNPTIIKYINKLFNNLINDQENSLKFTLLNIGLFTISLLITLYFFTPKNRNKYIPEDD